MTDSSHASRDLRGGLLSPSFLGLLATQFLGAMNDNIFRWLIVPIGKAYGGEAGGATALAMGAACLVVPFIVFAAHAGYLADRFSKRSVIIGCKVAEAAVMLLGVASIWFANESNYYWMFVVLFLMGAQSALFSPSKYGSIPEIVSPSKISAANGLIGLTTILAVIIGTIVGNYLYTWTGEFGKDRTWLSAATVVGVAVIGILTSLPIMRLPVANAARAFPWNPFAQTFRDLALLFRQRALLRVALGIAFFWSLASLAQLNVDAFGTQILELNQEKIGPLLGALSLGVGIGSLLAGFLSAGRIELGLVPMGAAGIAACSIGLFVDAGTFTSAAVWLFLLGTCAGLFDIPLEAFMQHRSEPHERGALLAANNFLTFSGILASTGLFWVFQAPLLADNRSMLSPRGIFLFAGVMTIPVTIYTVMALPQATMRFVVWLLSLTVYRIRVVGRENLPERTGALLVSNHVSWIDGILLMMTSSRPVRMIVYADYIEGSWIRWMAKLWGAIPIKPGRKSIIESLRVAREAIRNGDLVCIFPEGGLTRTGQLLSFRPGFLKIVQGTGAPVVPVYLDGLFGSIFSFYGGKCFWKKPRQWPYAVSIAFGKPLETTDDVYQVRRAVQDLGEQAVNKSIEKRLVLPRQMLRNCRRSMRRPKVADTMNVEMTGASLLLRSLIFRRLLLRGVLAADEMNVGVLLPPSGGAVLANAALALGRRVAVNLNYTVSADVMNVCIRQAGIRHVLTSRRVMEKLNMKMDAELVYVDELRDKVTTADKLACAVQAYATPIWLLERVLGLTKIKHDDVLTIIFTSGSTGEPKGVMLSHRNVGSNIDAFDQLVQLRDDDVVGGILPFFHSFGYTVTLWTVLTLPPKGVYHFTPLDARHVGEMCRKHGATILVTTPTFLRSYTKRCDEEDFAKLEVVIAGAEKLTKDVSDAFEQKFGVRPHEGYGATELSPVAAVNVPAKRAAETEQLLAKEGTVGRTLPGITAKVLHTETGEELGANQPGLLWIKGPNVMLGYLNRPDLTDKVVRDGWYNTGDIALVDDDGFIQITGRESRFSKIGGEMVPHLRIEEAINEIVGAGEELKAVVTAVPDDRKGERLVVVHTHLEQSHDAIRRGLSEMGLPNLWIPSQDSFCEVESIPVLGTGKLDLKGLKDLAMERFAAEASHRAG